MNILLSTLNAKYIHSSLALRYIKAFAEKEGALEGTDITYKIAEYTINMPIYEILRQITQEGCQVIGFCCYIWNIEMTLHLAKLIKSVRPEITLVLGGPEVTYCADEILTEHPYVSYIVQGEGEEAFTQLVLALYKGEKQPYIEGIRGRTEEGVLFGPTEPVEVAHLDDIPFPYTEEDMIDLKHKIVYYESSRGCPFSCQYCLSGNRNKVRFFSTERTLQELQWFIDHGVKQVKFVDRTFNCSKAHHIPLMEFIQKAETETNFHLEMEGVLLTEQEVRLLNDAAPGRFQIEVGVQSTHLPTLEAIRRRNEWSHISQMVQPIIDGGTTHVHLDLIIGLPHESYTIFKKSFSQLYSLQPQALQLGFLKLLKGSGVRRMADYAYVYDPEAPYEVLQNHVLSYDEVAFLKVFEDVFETFYNSERYIQTCTCLFHLLEEAKLVQSTRAFDVWETLTHLWIQKGYDRIKLNDRDKSIFLYEAMGKLGEKLPFLEGKGALLQDMVRLDILLAFKGKVKGDALGLPTYDKAMLQASEAFWQQEDLVRQYIPDFAFTEWRRLRQDFYEMVIAPATQAYLGVSTPHLIVHVEGAYKPFGRPLMGA